MKVILAVRNLSVSDTSGNIAHMAHDVQPWYKHKLRDIYIIHWYKLQQLLSAAAHVTDQSSRLLQFADVIHAHLSAAASFSVFYSRVRTILASSI